MDYKIIFLGTAGGKESIYEQLRGSGGMILKLGNYQMHLDPGPGALVQAVQAGINPRNTNVVLCSHNHVGHCSDVNVLVDAMTFSGLDKRGILISDKSVVEGLDNEKPILLEQYKNYLEKVAVVNPGERIKMGTVEIEALQTRHRCPTAVGFKFYTARFNLTYTSDTRYFKEMEELYSGSDIIIINNLRPFGSKSDNDSMSTDDSLKLIKAINPKLAVLTHFSKNMIKENPLYQAREIQKDTKIQTVAAKDGLVIDLAAHSNSMKQRMLSVY